MQYTPDQLSKVTQCGMLSYPPQKIVNIFDFEDEAKFLADFENKESEIYKAYQKGKDKADFIIDHKLFELAQKGDLNALKEFKLRKLKNENTTH
jgi:3-methyladenine DNA glycosylase AlkC